MLKRLTSRHITWRRIVGGAALAAILAGVGAVQAASRQDLEAVRAAVHAFITGAHAGDAYPPQVRVGALDPRLRLGACSGGLEVDYANHRVRRSGRVLTAVRCSAPVQWRLYVPVQVDAFADVVVARRALPRGHVLQRTDLALEKRNLARLTQGFYREAAALEAWVTRRPLPAGAALTPGAVTQPRLVRNGERVALVASASGVQVVARGTALADGAAGETVRVRNASSGRVVEGRVIARGKVAVD